MNSKPLRTKVPTARSESQNPGHHPSPTEFVREIRKELGSGVAFTPFVGSGISAQSGILMSSAFTNYTTYCVWKVLGCPTFSEGTLVKVEAWDLIRDGWPPYPHRREVNEAMGYFLRWYSDYAENLGHRVKISKAAVPLIEGFSPIRNSASKQTGKKSPDPDFDLIRPLIPNILRSEVVWSVEEALRDRKKLHSIKNIPTDPNGSRSSPSYITEVAVRSLSHWTDTIEFLASSRVRCGATRTLSLDEPESAVIDSFNQHITLGKHPNLIHNLLSRLSRSLRAHLILTTNFDTLLEQAFSAQKESLHVIPVSTKGNLPAYATVRAQNCLIKLHGDLLETRADSSINTPPASVDLARFLDYLRGPEYSDQPTPINFVQSHLLVLGYSASDARCVQLIKHVLDLDKKFKVFWVCHDESGLTKVNALFSDYLQNGNRFQTVVTDRTDLLLLELYQAINLSLPGGGYNFKFTHHVPPLHVQAIEKFPAKARSSATSDPKRKELFEKVKEITGRKHRAGKVVAGKVVTIDYKSGLAGPCRDLFQDFLSEGVNTLWFELEDHRNPVAFLWDAFGAIGLRRGATRSGSTNFLPAEILDFFEADSKIPTGAARDVLLNAFDRRIELFIDRYGIDPTNWALFLYGRNGPGGCTGWQIRYWSKTEHEFFCDILIRLSNHGFRLIYMPFGDLRSARNKMKVGELFKHLGSRSKGRLGTSLKSMDRSSCPVAIREIYKTPADFRELPSRLLPASPRPQLGVKASRFPSYSQILDSVFNGFFKVQDPSFDERLRSTRMLWLYGLTLFRQSRHSAAMISEAVFPCPWKFNTEKRDNDRSRYGRIFQVKPYPDIEFYCEEPEDADHVGWSNWLEEKGLFLKKPGGFSWMYRDTRLGIQYILEQVHEVEIGPNPFAIVPLPGKAKRASKVRLLDLRPRIHYWIADWYLKAFYSSGHSTPLVECIYHSAQAIILSSEYFPPSLVGKKDSVGSARIQLAWTAVCLMRRAIRHGQSCFQLWSPGVDARAVFMDDLNPLQEAVRKLHEWKRQNASQKPRGLCKALIDSLADGGAVDMEMRALRDMVIAEGFAHRSKPIPKLTSPLPVGRSKSDDPKDFKRDPWSRKYWFEATFERIRSLFQLGPRSLHPSGPNDYHRAIRDARFDWVKQWDADGADPQALINLAWGLSSLTYDILRPAKLEFHLETLRSRKTGASNSSAASEAHSTDLVYHNSKRWLLICSIIYHSLQLCRLIPPDYEKYERDLRIRLLSTYGLALGCLGRSSEANRRFNEAHALALTRATEELPLQLARIHLRRAEMSIYCFHASSPNNRKRAISCMEEQESPASARFAHLDDAWAAIERGDAALSGHNQSSFWWYRIAVTKLSCLAALAQASHEHGVSPSASFPLRRRQHLPTVIEGLLGEALYSAEGDHFRELRAVDYALRASTMRHEEPAGLLDGAGVNSKGDGVNSVSFLIKNLSRISTEEDQDWERRRLYTNLKRVLSQRISKNSHLKEYILELRKAYKPKSN